MIKTSSAVLCQDSLECFGGNSAPVYLVLDNFHLPPDSAKS